MFQHLLVAWRSGWRSRSFRAVFILGCLAMAGAHLAGQFSGRQPATVALDVSFSAVRLVMLLMVLVWCQEVLAKDVERKTVYFVLAYPLKRASYMVGRYLGVLALVAVSLLVLAALQQLVVRFSGVGYSPTTPVDLGAGFWLTVAYIWLDVAVVAAFTFMVTSFSTSLMMPLAMGAAFSVAARMLGQTLEYLRSSDSRITGGFRDLIENFQWVLPDLSRLDVRVTALYGVWPSSSALTYSALMAASYAVVMLVIAVVAFSRREMM